MGLIDEELEKTHVKEERKLRFEEFVKAQKAAGSKGMKLACLQSHGHRDFYGKVVFATGMHKSMWILPVADNPKALLYAKRKDAEGYAKELQGILRGNGYPFSKAWAEQVALQTVKKHPYSALVQPVVTYESAERYVICMKVR